MTDKQQVAQGVVLMQFQKEGGEWNVLWHSNYSDYNQVKGIVKAYEEPEPMVEALKTAGFKVSAEFLPSTRS